MSDCVTYYLDELQPSVEERSRLKAVLSLIILSSTTCLLIALHNIYKYLFKDDRWRIFLLSMFYTSVVFQLAFQISNASVMIEFYSNKPVCNKAFAAFELDTCTTYMAAIFGVFQVASIAELLIFTRYSTLALHFSSGALDHTKVDRNIRMLYRVTYLAIIALLCLMVLFLATQSKSENIFQPQNNKQFGVVTGLIFLIISASLIVSTFLLLKELKKEQLKFLKEETRSLGVLLVVFQFSYFARAVFLLGFGNWYKVQEHMRQNQSPSQAYYERHVIYYSSFLIWDLPPVLFQLIVHVKNFKVDVRQSVSAAKTDHSPTSIRDCRSTVKDGEVDFN